MNTTATNRKTKTVILLLLIFGELLSTFDKVAINVAVIPISKEFGLTETQMGLVISSFFLSFAIMQPIGGSLADRFGTRKVIIISLFSWSMITIFTGLAWSLASLIAIRFLFGIGEGSYPAASVAAIGETFPFEERSRAKSTLSAGGKIGGALGSLFVAGLITGFGWKLMFVILGCVGLLLSPLYIKYYHPGGTDVQKHGTNEKITLIELFKKPLLWKLMVVYFGFSIVSWGSQSWLPSYMVNVHHLNLVSMGALITIPAIFTIVGVIGIGWILDKYVAGREKIVIITGSLTTIISLLFLTQSPSIVEVLICMTIASISIVSGVVTIFTIILKHIPGSGVGRASGWIYLSGNLAGVVAPTVMGFMIERFNGSYEAGFWFLIAALIISLLIGLTIQTNTDKTNKKEREIGFQVQ